MSLHLNEVIQIKAFDGQIVWLDGNVAFFEVGNFLGGGAAGTVYECENLKSKEHFAMKILNPLGYKLTSSTIIRKCSILLEGRPTSHPDACISTDHVWWLLNNSSKQYITSFYCEKSNMLKELSLDQCVRVWGLKPAGVDLESENTNLEQRILPNGLKIFIPKVPPKYLEYLRKRSRIFREIDNMKKISNHQNVIKLEAVLELIQETKGSIFLIMELANGGELFDRIKVDCGTKEETAIYFFQQVLMGVQHCHEQGVCHRDLKPENLLLQDIFGHTILKIADFGFSARFAMDTDDGRQWPSTIYQQQSNELETSPIRVLKSIVGSPFYVAPEIMTSRGYDGPKADIWSLGVILYAMLAGNLPFGQDLSICKRFKTFCKWIRQCGLKGADLWNENTLEFPDWLFPSKFSALSKGLIASMLHPDPICRISVATAMAHPLCRPSESSKFRVQGDSIPIADTSFQEMTLDRNYNHRDNFDDQSGVFLMEEDKDQIENNPIVSHDYSVTTTAVSSYHDNIAPTPDRNLVSYSESMGSYGSSPIREGQASSSLSRPPPAPAILFPDTIDDLIDVNEEDFEFAMQPITPHRRQHLDDAANGQPPSFNDAVKRSTRFITAVPAHQVLVQVEAILEECRTAKVLTPIGFITRIDLNWETFRLDVWSGDYASTLACSLQMYQLTTPLDSIASTPRTSEVFSSRYSETISQSPALHLSALASYHENSSTQELYLVEFMRGQLEIFTFKRFYQWVRQKLSQLVKRDYSLKLFEHMSPKIDYEYLLNLKNV